MGHNPKIPLGFRPRDLDDAHRVAQPVTVYCLNCARGRHHSPWQLMTLRGNITFGTLQGGFWCRQCRASSVVVIFPCDIATPREWVRRDGAPPKRRERVGQ